jgi:hypothetical protein
VIFRNLKEGFYMTERQEAYNQTANNSYFRAECQAVKRAVYNPDAFSNSTYHIVHQSRNIFTTKDDADATASLYLRGSGHIQHYLAHDFAKPISGGRWGNQKTYDVVGNFTNLTPEPIDVGIATNYEGEYCRISLRNPSNRSIFPRSTASAFIPELHDQLLDGVLSGSYTVTAYQGDGFSDPKTQFPAMITDSTTAGIPISSDISIINPDRLFDYSGAGGTKMRLIWNANAVAGNDYVELVIDGGSPRQLTKLIMVMSNTSNSYIHVMRGLLGGAMGDNKFIAVNAMAASENGLRLFEFELGGGGVRDWIIRWIGLGLAAEINVFGLYASGLYFDGPPPVITKHGGTIYGPLIMGQEAGIVERTSTSANLGSAVHVINTSDSKQLGFRVYNTTTKTDYVAQGSNDTSTWIDTSNGTTIITPS